MDEGLRCMHFPRHKYFHQCSGEVQHIFTTFLYGGSKGFETFRWYRGSVAKRCKMQMSA